jgi:hypothetical protein
MGSECMLGRLVGGVKWIPLLRDRDHWRAVVNAMMNLQDPAPRIYLFSNISISTPLVALRRATCMEIVPRILHCCVTCLLNVNIDSKCWIF